MKRTRQRQLARIGAAIDARRHHERTQLTASEDLRFVLEALMQGHTLPPRAPDCYRSHDDPTTCDSCAEWHQLADRALRYCYTENVQRRPLWLWLVVLAERDFWPLPVEDRARIHDAYMRFKDNDEYHLLATEWHIDRALETDIDAIRAKLALWR